MAMKRFETNGNPQEFAGNNCFHLRTIDDNKNVITLTGILKEMPSFGLSTEWTEAPRATFGKKIQEFFMSDLINTASFLSGAENTTQLLNDEWSSRMYAGTTNKDITLNFRIYTQEPLGQSAAGMWLEYLSKYATTSGASTLKITTLEENIKNTLSAIDTTTGEIGTQFCNFISKSEIDKNSNEIIKKRKKNIYNIVKNITKYLNEAIDNVKKVMLESMKNQTIKDWKHSIGNKIVIDTNIDDIINGLKIEITNKKTYTEKIGYNGTWEYVNLKDQPFNLKFTWKKRKQANNPGTEDPSKEVEKPFDTTSCKLDVNSIIEEIKKHKDWSDDEQQVFGMSFVETYFKEVLMYINKKITENKLDFDETVENGNMLLSNKDFIKYVENTLASNYATEDRWSNVDFLAARLWQLDIFRFIFKKPIIVAITDWKVTPSLEMMDHDHTYYDFSITCRPDQVKSLPRWKDVIIYEPKPKVD